MHTSESTGTTDVELLKMFFCIICNCLKRCKHLEVGGGRGGVGMGWEVASTGAGSVREH